MNALDWDATDNPGQSDTRRPHLLANISAIRPKHMGVTMERNKQTEFTQTAEIVLMTASEDTALCSC